MKDNKELFPFLITFARSIVNDDVGVYAAQAAFFIIISFFPFVMLFMSVLSYIPLDFSQLPQSGIDLPESVTELLSEILSEIRQKKSIPLISVSTLTGLWSASKGLFALTNGLNSVYGTKAAIGSIKTRIFSVFNTVAFGISLLATLMLWTFGSEIAAKISFYLPYFTLFDKLLTVFRSIIGYLFLTVFFWLIYIFAPNRKTKALSELPGAMICAAGWIGFSFVFSFYFNNFSLYTYIYGSLAAIVLLMLWVYFCIYILLVGAEINKAIARLYD